MVGDALVAVDQDILASIKMLGSPKPEGWSVFSSESKPLTCFEKKKMRKLAKDHKARLQLLNKATVGGNKVKVAALQELYLASYAARVCAVVRALHRRECLASASEIEALAQSIDLWEPTSELVLLEPISKAPKPGWRVIVKHGLKRTIQQLVVRDLLFAMGIDSEFDYTRKHAGGEKAYIRMICDYIDDDYEWWCVADVKNCFPSLRPKHFRWLPIPYHLVKNVLFLPKCIQIQVKYPKGEACLLSGDTPHEILPSKSSLIRIAKQGLPQGAACSPLLARSLVGRELRNVFGEWEVVGGSYMDDLAIGAHSQKEAEAAFNALVKRLQSLPAGPLELHGGKVEPAKKGLFALGYRLEPDNGYQPDPNKARPVHVKPAKPRIGRFKQRLERLLKSAPTDADLFQIGDMYWKQWFSAQQAWTTVPGESEPLSRHIASTYVQDFIDGVPMGENYKMITAKNKQP